jgi:hypothetical protein
MKTIVRQSLVLLAALASWTIASAQAPLGATGQCKDGSYSMAEAKKGACGKHGGVKEWYENNRPEKGVTAPAASEPAKSTAAKAAPPASEGRATAAAGGGPGQVWVNTRSKVYHCQGDKWYGKTIKGEYMTEGDAKSRGAHADHGKVCS